MNQLIAKTLVFIALSAGLTGQVCAQGRIALNNAPNTSTDPAASSNGLFWLSTGGTPALINQDFNAAFYIGTSSDSLPLIRTFLLSNGTAANDNSFGPGTFRDPLGAEYSIPGASSSAFVQIQAWTGNFDSYDAAINGGAFAAESPVFINPVSIPPGAASDLVNMPAMVLAVPEPSTFALLGLAAIVVLPLLRRKSG